ncbi:hypothetical protein P167DRAFT_535754 [Morchella conica CCBAS932]|uniref:Uncharacterized protein n=1 Tax=Morchella conica CCBAS932 TaxID=1392247 RepID=A0A3N4KTD9_9PEZI|nr:hypothetical protein P167DRAFT_535754 [Morchella conica CCBAS932]
MPLGLFQVFLAKHTRTGAPPTTITVHHPSPPLLRAEKIPNVFCCARINDCPSQHVAPSPVFDGGNCFGVVEVS